MHRMFLIESSSLNVFGFLGGEEIKNASAGNLGLQDRKQR